MGVMLPADSPYRKEVSRRWLLLEAERGNTDGVSSIAAGARQLFEDDPEELFEIASALHDFEQYVAAGYMLEPVLEDPRHEEQRTGAHHLLAGQLALRLGRFADTLRMALRAEVSPSRTGSTHRSL